MLKKKSSSDEQPIEVAKRSISVATVFVIVGLLFSVLVFAMYFFRYNEASPFYSYYYKPSVTTTLGNSVRTGINKTASGKPIELNLTEAQISQAICISCDSFPLKKGALTVRPEGIIISGRTTTAFWGVNLETTLTPKVDNGKLVFNLTDFKAAGVSAPPKITQTYSSKIKDLFANVIPSSQSINVTEVHSLIGSIEIVGTKK